MKFYGKNLIVVISECKSIYNLKNNLELKSINKLLFNIQQ